MNILIIGLREKPYDALSVRVAPSGGTEKAMVFLSEAFTKLGHRVSLVSTYDALSSLLAGERALPPELYDIVITQAAELLEYFPKAYKVWWCHQFTDQPMLQNCLDAARRFADKVVTLSRCQAEDFLHTWRLNSVVVGYGLWLEEIAPPVEKDPYRLIYASTPYRGLDKVIELFKLIQEREPRATIAVASSMATYGYPELDQKYQGIFDALGRMPGVQLFGSLNQAELYQELSKASIFFYPCTFPETYCLVMDEAIAHGCRPCVTALGALPERVQTDFQVIDPEIPLRMMMDSQWNPNPSIQYPKNWLQVAQQWETDVFS